MLFIFLKKHFIMKNKINAHGSTGYKIILPLIFLLVLQCFPSFTNGQTTTFQKIYTATLNQSGRDVLPAPDGGYIIAGSTENTIVNDIDVKIVKTNNSGDTLWSKKYGGSRPDYPNRMLATNDGNYFIVGSTQSFGGGDQDIYLLKINPSGDTLWTKRYGGFGNEDGNEITATADGNYVIVGGSNSVNLSNNDIQFIKIDPAGSVIWMKYYGGPDYESARSVKLCLDGGFIIAGKTASTSNSVATLFLVKTDASGDTIWTKKYSGGGNSYEGKSILASSDGTYTLCLDDSSGARDSDVRVMKISATGSVLWNKMYGGIDKDIAKMIQPTSDGGYIIASVCRSFGWLSPDMWLLKLDALGDTTWTKHYGGPGHEHCYAVRQTADGGYVAVGHTKSYTPNTEIMLIKLDATGKIADGIEEFVVNNSIGIYPNPTDGLFKITFSDPVSSSVITICNLAGQEIVSEKINPFQTVDLRGAADGIYFVSVKLNNQLSTKKIILENK